MTDEKSWNLWLLAFYEEATENEKMQMMAEMYGLRQYEGLRLLGNGPDPGETFPVSVTVVKRWTERKKREREARHE